MCHSTYESCCDRATDAAPKRGQSQSAARTLRAMKEKNPSAEIAVSGQEPVKIPIVHPGHTAGCVKRRLFQIVIEIDEVLAASAAVAIDARLNSASQSLRTHLGWRRRNLPRWRVLDVVPVAIFRIPGLTVLATGTIHHGDRHQRLTVSSVVLFDQNGPVRWLLRILPGHLIGKHSDKRSVRTLPLVQLIRSTGKGSPFVISERRRCQILPEATFEGVVHLLWRCGAGIRVRLARGLRADLQRQQYTGHDEGSRECDDFPHQSGSLKPNIEPSEPAS